MCVCTPIRSPIDDIEIISIVSLHYDLIIGVDLYGESRISKVKNVRNSKLRS